MKGTLRTFFSETRELVLIRIKDIVDNIPKTLGGRGEFFREEGYISLINHNDMVDLVRNNGYSLLGKENVIEIKEPSLGVEDFAYFLKEIKGAYYRLGCRNEEKGIIYDGHHDRFNIDEDCLPIGVALQVLNVLNI
ncbi:M20/M25/M40 family metallo-hydrolase [Anaeromonas gelatinilytica]|uniref:M20/M25/M40 family metallo-hydrolase n=1 Tax=Anaeromonas gelatinilytica TaxID=2683194 RepID=UPI003314E3FB